ncbi:MAG: NTP transferase domain-containing protein [Candidatus Portnoybacteria bacterium]|nr:NTP transferase domain-containing protein [Candidatus Portnoybacteria bacterium]
MRKIVILAAGKGTRMKSELTKPAVPLAGRPIIEYLVSSVVESGVDKKPVIAVSPDNQEAIEEVLKEYPCQYVIQKEALGTGHALACAKEAVGQAEYVLSLYGDHPFIRPETIRNIFKQNNGPVTITTAKLEDFRGWRKNFHHWGRIIRKNDSVDEIIEFKDASQEMRSIKELNVGFYCFKTSWLWENIKKIKNDNASGEYYLTDLVKICREQNLPVNSMEIDIKEAIGINTFEELRIVEKMVCLI